MPCELLIHSFSHRKAVKGQIQSIRDVSDLSAHPWGTKEGLPNYVILTISNRTAAQVSQYLENIRSIFQWELLNSNAQGRRYRIWLIQKVVDLDPSKAMRAKLRDFLIDEYSASLVSYTPPSEAVFDIPNTDWQFLADAVTDYFEVQVATRRWYFAEADVDVAIANGGRITLSSAQAANRIIDRLA